MTERRYMIIEERRQRLALALFLGATILGCAAFSPAPLPVRADELAVGGHAISLLIGTGRGGNWSWSIQENLQLRVAGSGNGGSSWQGEFILTSGASTGETLQVNRLFLQWERGPTRVTLGRQRIAWGVGYAFSPLDQFNPPNPLDPSAPRLGVDALVLRRSTGDLSYLSAVAVLPRASVFPAGQPATIEPALGAVWGFHAARTGLALSYLSDPARSLHQWGLTAKGDLGVGWHLEGVYQRPRESAGGAQWLGVAGLDYSFLDGQLVCLVEYFYDETGEADPALYDYSLFEGGRRQLLGERYLFAQARYQVDEFTSASLAGLANLADGSLLLQPGWSWLADDHLRVDLGLAVPLGREGTELKRTAPEVSLTAKVRYSF